MKSEHVFISLGLLAYVCVMGYGIYVRNFEPLERHEPQAESESVPTRTPTPRPTSWPMITHTPTRIVEKNCWESAGPGVDYRPVACTPTPTASDLEKRVEAIEAFLIHVSREAGK